MLEFRRDGAGECLGAAAGSGLDLWFVCVSPSKNGFSLTFLQRGISGSYILFCGIWYLR